jgi:hypothetical protein
LTSCSAWTTPRPRHGLHGFVMMLPSPSHFLQVVWYWRNPCIVMVSTPAPLHTGQDVGRVPSAAPVPLQSPHAARVWYRSVRVVPVTASSKSICISVWTSAPLRGPFPPPPPRCPNPPAPPNISCKLLNKSSWDCPWPLLIPRPPCHTCHTCLCEHQHQRQVARTGDTVTAGVGTRKAEHNAPAKATKLLSTTTRVVLLPGVLIPKRFIRL